MTARQVAAAGIALVLGGCAAATPGYQPSTPKLEKYKAQIQRGGGFDAAGNYALSEQEQALNCKQLTGSVTIKILQMREAQNRAPPSAVAALAQNAVRPVIGGATYGSNIEADLRRDRARLEAFNAQLARKDCPVFDLAKELRPGNKDRPRPVKAAGRKA
jgi:hypothetical protein